MKRNEPPINIYTSESRIKKPTVLFKSIFKEIGVAKDLGLILAVRDIKQRYRQSILGILWIIVPPIITTVIFVFLNERNILNIPDTELPYPVYVMIGTILWQIFVQSVNAPLGAFKGSMPIMTKISIPAEAPIISGTLQVLFTLATQFIVIFGTLLYFKIEIQLGLIFSLIPIFILILFGTIIGLFLIPLGFLFQDVPQLANVALRFWFFITPIVYPPPASWPYSLIVGLNPVTPVLIAARDLMTKGTVENAFTLLVFSLAIAIMLAIALLFYRISIPILVERESA